MYRNYAPPEEMEYYAFGHDEGWGPSEEWVQPAEQNGWQTRDQEGHPSWSSNYWPEGPYDNQPTWTRESYWTQAEAESDWSSSVQHHQSWDCSGQRQPAWSSRCPPDWSGDDQYNLAASYELQPNYPWSQEPQEDPYSMQYNTGEVDANQSARKDLLGDLWNTQRQIQKITQQMTQVAASLSEMCEETIAWRREEAELAKENDPVMKEPVDRENLQNTEEYQEVEPIPEQIAKSIPERAIEAEGCCDPDPLPSEVPPPLNEHTEEKIKKEDQEVVVDTESEEEEELEPAGLEDIKQSALIQRPQEESSPSQPETQPSQCTYQISYPNIQKKALHQRICSLLGTCAKKLLINKPEEDKEQIPPAKQVPPEPPDLAWLF